MNDMEQFGTNADGLTPPLVSAAEQILVVLGAPEHFKTGFRFDRLQAETPELRALPPGELRRVVRLCDAFGLLRGYRETEDGGGFEANGLTKLGLRMLDGLPIDAPCNLLDTVAFWMNIILLSSVPTLIK